MSTLDEHGVLRILLGLCPGGEFFIRIAPVFAAQAFPWSRIKAFASRNGNSFKRYRKVKRVQGSNCGLEDSSITCSDGLLRHFRVNKKKQVASREEIIY